MTASGGREAMERRTIAVEKRVGGRRYGAEVYRAGGVYRWASNDAVVPLDAAREYGVIALPGYSHLRQAAARQEEIMASVEQYRARRTARGYSDEERAELRAAFGAGVEVVDALTGERIDL